jgi:hypothetical protein
MECFAYIRFHFTRITDEVTLDLSGIRPISITFTGVIRRKKGYSCSSQLRVQEKNEISCWIKQADHQEKHQPGTSPSKRVGVRQRLNRSSDDLH